MGFTSFLKKVGLGIVKYVPLVLAGAPLIEQAAPKSAPFFDRLASIFDKGMSIEKDFEAAFKDQKTGPQKLLALTAYVGDILKQSELAIGHEIADEAAVQKSASAIAQAVVDFLQALKGKDGSNAVAG